MEHCLLQKMFLFDLRHESFLQYQSSLHSEKLTDFASYARIVIISTAGAARQLYPFDKGQKRKIICFMAKALGQAQHCLIATWCYSIQWLPSSLQVSSVQFLMANCPYLHWKLRAITRRIRNGPCCEAWRIFSAFIVPPPKQNKGKLTCLYICQVRFTSLLDWLKTSVYPQQPAQSLIHLKIRQTKTKALH